VLEFAIKKSITRHVDPAFGQNPDLPIRHRGLDTMLESVSTLLSLLALLEETPETRRAAFDTGVQNLNHPESSDFNFQDSDPDNLAAFDRTLDDLAHAAPMYRANIMYACDALVSMNDDVTPRQILLICAVADTLRRPRPDWVS